MLRSDLPNPLARGENDEEKGTVEPATSGTADEGVVPSATRIDFYGIDQRIIALPVGAADISNIQAGEAGMLFYTRRADGATVLHRYDLAERKDDTFLPDFGGGYAISADGKKLMYTQGGSTFVVGAASPPKAGQGRVATDAVQVRIDPRAEWAQIFDEAWRINRDYFYAPNMHGVTGKRRRKSTSPSLRMR